MHRQNSAFVEYEKLQTPHLKSLNRVQKHPRDLGLNR